MLVINLPRPTDVHLLDGQLALVVTHHAQEPVGVKLHRPHVAVLASSHHHIVDALSSPYWSMLESEDINIKRKKISRIHFSCWC